MGNLFERRETTTTMQLLICLCVLSATASGCAMFSYPGYLDTQKAYDDCIARYPEMPDLCESNRTDRDEAYRSYSKDAEFLGEILNDALGGGSKR